MTANYWTYSEMLETLHEWSNTSPDLMEITVIGQSREGRDIPVVALTNRLTGLAEEKSAIFVDANIHAGEVATNSAAMYWIQWCLENYGTHGEATELLDHHTVYVVPRISVDGAELYLTTPVRFRSSAHSYPHSEPPEGYIAQDMNGDGHILQMRVPAADGAFAVDLIDDRIMRPRRPGEMGGKYYHVFPEGRIERLSQTGELPAFGQAKLARRSTMDFNRNFPIRWAGESGQPGAGPYPLSEPELRHLANFILAHRNIAAYVALHTTGGVILRQPSTGDDTVLSEADRHLFTRVGEMGAEATGYFVGSNYNIFASGHEKVLMPGAADDWMYDHHGILSFTVELWNLPKQAGARGYAELGMRRMMTLTPEERTEDLRKIYAWTEREVGKDGVFAWSAYDHPDFGPVEIGGLNPKFVVQNPPLHLLEDECVGVSTFLTRLGLSTAKLIIPSVQVSPIGEGLFRVVAEVSNAGFLPTSSTEKGKELLLEGVRASIAGSVQMVAGISPTLIGHLDGYGSQDAYSPPKSQRGYAEWVIQGTPGVSLTVTFEGPRSGRVSTTICLGEAEG